MTKILAVETSTKICSIALIEGNEISGEISLNVRHIHAERLVVMINNLLENLRLPYTDLDAVAVSNGPGSFTGLRIGLSVVKGIAFALEKKLIDVPTLDAIAYGMRSFCEGKTIVPILHARAEEFYYTSFKLDNEKFTRKKNYSSANAEDIAREFSHGHKLGSENDTIFVGEGAQEFARKLSASSYHPTAIFVPASAKNVGYLAMEKFKSGEFADVKSLVPLYIKDFVALKKNSYRKLFTLKSGV